MVTDGWVWIGQYFPVISLSSAREVTKRLETGSVSQLAWHSESFMIRCEER